jgi:pimeloyl-ACP methyl ester carboxylesterase
MFPTFLPSQVKQIQDADGIALLQYIERIAITTPLSSQPILTTYIHQGSTGTPILLLHGFDSSFLEFRLLFPIAVMLPKLNNQKL